MGDQFRSKFLDKIDNENFQRFSLPSTDDYRQMVNMLSNVNESRDRTYYYVKRKFSLIDVHELKKIIKPPKKPGDPPTYIAAKSELFDILLEAHVSTNHGGEKKPKQVVDERYSNVTMKMVSIFVSHCETCQRKKSKPNKGLVVRPIRNDSFGSRGQVDLVNMESTPDRGFVQILNYQDHFTKFLILRPMKSKTATETAHNLIDIFTTILQSDNGREFVAGVINELKMMWPQLTIVHVRARHPQSQGSVERSNADVKQKLIAWTVDNASTQWAEGLRFVQHQKNSTPHRNLANKSPYHVVFGQKPMLGLLRTTLPREVIAHLETEEELESALREMHDDSSNLPTEEGATTERPASECEESEEEERERDGELQSALESERYGDREENGASDLDRLFRQIRARSTPGQQARLDPVASRIDAISNQRANAALGQERSRQEMSRSAQQSAGETTPGQQARSAQQSAGETASGEGASFGRLDPVASRIDAILDQRANAALGQERSRQEMSRSAQQSAGETTPGQQARSAQHCL